MLKYKCTSTPSSLLSPRRQGLLLPHGPHPLSSPSTPPPLALGGKPLTLLHVRTAQTPLGKVTLSLPPSLSPSCPTAPASPSSAGPRLPRPPLPARACLAFLRRPAQARAGLARLFLVKEFSQHRCDMTRAWHVSLLGRHHRLRRSQNAVSSPSCWSRYRHRLRSLLALQPVELLLAQGQLSSLPGLSRLCRCIILPLNAYFSIIPHNTTKCIIPHNTTKCITPHNCA